MGFHVEVSPSSHSFNATCSGGGANGHDAPRGRLLSTISARDSFKRVTQHFEHTTHEDIIIILL
jgi:hypothetical protein